MLLGTTQNEKFTPFFTEESVLVDKNIKVCTVFLRQITLRWRKLISHKPHAYQYKKLSTTCNANIMGKLMQSFTEKNRPTSNRST